MSDTQTAHTPGPWAIHFTGTAHRINYGKGIKAKYKHHHRVADVPQWSMGQEDCGPNAEEAAANAHLIAAAPQLYEALEEIIDMLEEAGDVGQSSRITPYDLLMVCEAALKAARGEQS